MSNMNQNYPKGTSNVASTHPDDYAPTTKSTSADAPFLADWQLVEDVPEGIVKYESLLSRAKTCFFRHDYHSAIILYKQVLDEVSDKQSLSARLKQVADRAYNGLKSVCHGSSEYAFDSGSQYLDKYKALFND